MEGFEVIYMTNVKEGWRGYELSYVIPWGVS
jgi:hypothetical protein